MTFACAVAAAIEHNTVLTAVHLGINSLGPVGARQVARALASNRALTALTTLDLYRNKLGDDGAGGVGEAVGESSTLLTLNLRDNEVGDRGADRLARGLRRLSTLTTLVLSGNEVGSAGAESLAGLLGSDGPPLADLNLGDNKFGDAGAIHIATGAAGSTTLTDLNLSDNGVSAEGARVVADLLASSSCLTELDLSYNPLELGAGTLCEALASRLSTLNLAWTRIDDGGAQQIGQALDTASCQLKTLNLSGNSLGVAGVAMIARALCTHANSALAVLDLCSNRVGDEGALEVEKLASSNTVLRELHLRDNRITASGAASLARLLASRSLAVLGECCIISWLRFSSCVVRVCGGAGVCARVET